MLIGDGEGNLGGCRGPSGVQSPSNPRSSIGPTRAASGDRTPTKTRTKPPGTALGAPAKHGGTRPPKPPVGGSSPSTRAREPLETQGVFCLGRETEPFGGRYCPSAVHPPNGPSAGPLRHREEVFLQSVHCVLLHVGQD